MPEPLDIASITATINKLLDDQLRRAWGLPEVDPPLPVFDAKALARLEEKNYLAVEAERD
jgi:hypothetical protein